MHCLYVTLPVYALCLYATLPVCTACSLLFLYALYVRHSACMDCLYVTLSVHCMYATLHSVCCHRNTCACVLTPRIQCTNRSSLPGMLAGLTTCNTVKYPIPEYLRGLSTWKACGFSLSGILADPLYLDYLCVLTPELLDGPFAWKSCWSLFSCFKCEIAFLPGISQEQPSPPCSNNRKGWQPAHRGISSHNPHDPWKTGPETYK